MHDRLNLEQSDYQIPDKVSNLWLPNTKKWDRNKIIVLFGQDTLQVVGSRYLVAYAQQKVPTKC